MACRVLVLGHSFVWRLEHFSQSEDWLNLGFDVTDIDLRFIGIGGGTIRRGPKCIVNRDHLDAINVVQPHAVYLQIGGNDLSNKNCNPLSLLKDIMAYAEFLIQGYGVRHVIIGQLLPRFSQRCPSDYNQKVFSVNTDLVRLCSLSDSVSFWHHRGFGKDTKMLIDGDGVHLNRKGLLKYAKSVRASIGITKARGHIV